MIDSTFLFHNFPRRRDTVGFKPGFASPEEKRKGLLILRSIFEHGFLCVPEKVMVKEEFQPDCWVAEREVPVEQNRFCMTLLAHNELAAHAERFGPFAVGFRTALARRLGAMPVIYVPIEKAPDAPPGMGLVGHTVVRRLIELQYLLCDLAAIKQGAPAEALRLLDGLTPAQREQMRMSLGQLQSQIESLDDLGGTIRLVLKLFYPTERNAVQALDDHLTYYHQREWRLLTGVAAYGKDADAELTAGQKKLLHKIDPDFFSRIITHGNRSGEVVDFCRFIRQMEERPAWTAIDHLIIPSNCMMEAQTLAEDFGFPLAKIVPTGSEHTYSYLQD